MNGLLANLGRIFEKVEDFFLVSLLAAMILLAALQIFLRNIFDSGLIWADQLLRIQVLWVGIMGAVVASREYRHINIDLLSRLLPTGLRNFIGAITDLFTFSACALVAWHSGRFVHQEIEFGASGVGQFPAWIYQTIIPIGFGLIGIRYLISIISRLQGGRPNNNP
jgi:TRAP-type C4-dicarboxylate transport system permease small subunit